MRVKQENIWLEVMTDRLSPGPHVMTSSQVFSHSARPNSVNKHYISLYGLSNSKICLNWSLCPLFEPRNITNISLTSFHHVNCGVIQGFRALRKAITMHEKISYFSCMHDITNQLLTRHSPFAPLGQGDEWMVKPSPFSIQGCLWEFFQITVISSQ